MNSLFQLYDVSALVPQFIQVREEIVEIWQDSFSEIFAQYSYIFIALMFEYSYHHPILAFHLTIF